jgi:hypothetical protein
MRDQKRLSGAYIQRPGEDEFDVIFRTSEWSIGLFVFWVAAVRGCRWLKRSAIALVRRQPARRLMLPPPLKALPPPADRAGQ